MNEPLFCFSCHRENLEIQKRLYPSRGKEETVWVRCKTCGWEGELKRKVDDGEMG